MEPGFSSQTVGISGYNSACRKKTPAVKKDCQNSEKAVRNYSLKEDTFLGVQIVHCICVHINNLCVWFGDAFVFVILCVCVSFASNSSTRSQSGPAAVCWILSGQTTSNSKNLPKIESISGTNPKMITTSIQVVKYHRVNRVCSFAIICPNLWKHLRQHGWSYHVLSARKAASRRERYSLMSWREMPSIVAYLLQLFA